MAEVNFICFAMLLFTAALIGVLMPLYPVLTRKSFLFGVKIPPERQGSPEARALKKNYVAVCLAGSVILTALIFAQYFLFPDWSLAALLYFPFLFIILQTAAFIPNWKKAARLKAERGWAAPAMAYADTKSSHARGNLSELPWGWYAFSLALIAASAIAALYKYPGLPDMIPTHFDINMQPDAWTAKSLPAVLAMPLINLSTVIIFWLSGFMFVRAKFQIDQNNPGLSFAQHRVYRRRIGNGMGILAAGVTAMLAYTGFMSLFPDLYAPFWIMIAIPLAASAPLIAVTVISGQGGCRIKLKETEYGDGGDQSSTVKSTALGEAAGLGISAAHGEAAGHKINTGDDKYWLLGMLYYNPEDPAYIVESRFGNKLGFNYARLPVKISVAVLTAGIIALYAWITFALLPMLR